VQTPAEQPGQAHQNAEKSRNEGQRVEPFLLGQRGQGEQRDGDGQEGVGQVKLVVMEVEGIVLPAVGEGVFLGLLFLLALVVGESLVGLDGFGIGRAGIGGRGQALQAQGIGGGLPDKLADVAGLVVAPIVHAFGLGGLHGLHDVVVFDFAHAHKGGEQGDCDGDIGIEAAFALVLRAFLLVVTFCVFGGVEFQKRLQM